MNIFSIIGLIISTFVFLVGLKLSSPNLAIFLDGPSAFIVLGGIFAATSVAFQLNKIGSLFKVFIFQFLSKSSVDIKKIIKNIMQICESHRSGESIEGLLTRAEDPFLKEAMQLIADGILDKDKSFIVLEQRALQMNHLRKQDAQKIRSLSKFPPAFGMMGTTIGMIVLLANLGTGAEAMKIIGPAMGVCLITTLYGVAIANLIIIPVSENLLAMTSVLELKNKIILEGIRHIMDKSNPVLVAEDLNSFLLPKDRLDWRSVT